MVANIKFLFVAGLILCGTVCSAKQSTPIKISSDELKVNHVQKKAQFSGHVRAIYGEITLTCTKMKVSYNDKGSFTALIATGDVRVTHKEVQATAETARLEATKGLLILEGNATLKQGPHTLLGSSIQVDLKTKTIEVKKARGTFQLGLGVQK